MKRRRIREFAGLAQGAGSAAAGRADARTGHGYASSSGQGAGAALNQMRGYPEGYPYSDDLSSGNYEEEDEEDDPDDVDMAIKIAQSTLTRQSDAKPQQDRRAGTSDSSSRSFASSNALTFSEATYGIGSGPRSSAGVPSGSPHGWSRAPMWKKPEKKASDDNYRFKDIIIDDEEKEFEQLRARHYSVNEAVLRQFIKSVLVEEHE